MPEQQEILPHWKHLTSVRRGLTTTCNLCPARPYVSIALPNVKKNSGHSLVIRRALFTTISHDQGFSSDYPELKGSYEASHTFLEVRVVDCDGQDRIPYEELTRNRQAVFEFKEHVICWDFRDHDRWFKNVGRYVPAKYSGLIPSKWLAAIQPGDIIQVVPRAHFPAWVNYVAEARIELWLEELPMRPVEDPHPKEETHNKLSFFYNLVSKRIPRSSRSSYQPLRSEAKEIRVVEVIPSKDPQKPVRLILRRTSLVDEKRLKYEALSYCWGDGRQSVRITLVTDNATSVEVQISPNLERTLKRIRQPNETRIFWIDLLCINQRDTDERSRQVALMGEIYASAESVSVWLGELDEIVHTEEDLKVYQSIEKAYESSISRDELHAPVNDETGVTNWFNDRVFLRPWFQRVWVLQEVWNAASSIPDDRGTKTHRVSVLCGRFKLPWWVLMRANACFVRYSLRDYNNTTMPHLWMDLFTMSSNWENPELVAPGPRKPILDLVLRGLDFKATDPRDRIFALLGFGKETHRVTELPPSIKPDYGKTTAQVFCDFTLWWIETYRSLKILSAVHTLQERTWLDLSGGYDVHSDDGSSSHSDSPTWTPWYNGHSTWRYGTLALNDVHSYQACGNKVIDFQTLNESKTSIHSTRLDRLVPTFRGVRLGTIASIQPYPFLRLLDSEPSDMDKAFTSIFDPAGDLGMWRTARPAPGTVDLDSDRVNSALYSHWMSHFQDEDPLQSPEDRLPCLGKCMFETQNGRRGLCPSPTRPGDHVVVLYGGEVPYLLRAVGGDGLYAFVGECYLDGYMSGEAFTNGKETLQEQIFSLI